jgi:glycosyltransferase involved in cell wall biosynthesis
VLIIVENLSVPRDRRVWRECRALTDSGYLVSVICPRGLNEKFFQELSDVKIYRYPAPPPGTSAATYVFEYLASFIAIAVLTLFVAIRDGFRVLQACNPPDIFFPLGLLVKALGGSFVFDHHDLCPEVFVARFGSDQGFLPRTLRLLERLTLRSASHVISTNGSYRRIALERAGISESNVTVVRNGPELVSRPGPSPKSELGLPENSKHLVVYVGVMGPQDGVDLALQAVHYLIRTLGRRDTMFVFIGNGDSEHDLRQLVDELELSDWVRFTGFVPDDTPRFMNLLASADVGLCPDPQTPFNDLSSMTKTAEYMAYGLPIVAFDLRETRLTAEDAAVYATPNDTHEFARLIDSLLSHPDRRQVMGQFGRNKVHHELAWEHQRDAYVAVYQHLLQQGAQPAALDSTRT